MFLHLRYSSIFQNANPKPAHTLPYTEKNSLMCWCPFCLCGLNWSKSCSGKRKNRKIKAVHSCKGFFRPTCWNRGWDCKKRRQGLWDGGDFAWEDKGGEGEGWEETIILLLLFEFNLFLFCFLCSLTGTHYYELNEMQAGYCSEYVFHVHVHYLSLNSSVLRI